MLVALTKIFLPDLAVRAGELDTTVRLVIDGRLEPTPRLLAFFDLYPSPKGTYVWIPR